MCWYSAMTLIKVIVMPVYTLIVHTGPLVHQETVQEIDGIKMFRSHVQVDSLAIYSN
jgi:hypothetical protein